MDFWPKNGTKSTLDLLIHGRDNFLHSPFATKVQWAENEILMDTTKIWSRVSTTGLKMANDFLKVPSIRLSMRGTIFCKVFFVKAIPCNFTLHFHRTILIVSYECGSYLYQRGHRFGKYIGFGHLLVPQSQVLKDV